jgi:two-component system NarL family sensor kinase
VAAPTTAVYFASSVATRAANQEPFASIALRTYLLGGLGAACVALSWIQRSRVAAIAALLGDRTRLLDELVHLGDREHRQLSERLHDGALQYVLAARLDLDDVRAEAPADAVERIDHALAQAARLLRSTVSELHPDLLERTGLASALRSLAVASARGNLAVDVDLDGWPGGLRTTADPLLFGAARELVGNAVKHAGAERIRLSLAYHGTTARLVVADDGRGIEAGERQHRLDEGHIGLYSQAVRIEAAGGTLSVVGAPTGTVATVELPVTATPATPSPG